MHIKSARFVKSAAKMSQSPALDVPEVAIIGRSNVGKSTLINFLTNRKELAKASKMPGKTTLINFFLINDAWMLVDFPGYGYAKKGKGTRVEWMDTMQEYLTEKNNLKEMLLLINGHLPPQKVDKLMIEALDDSEMENYTIVVTKMDKAPMKEISRNMKALKSWMKDKGFTIPHFLYVSSFKKQGKDGVLTWIEEKVGV